MKFVPEVIGRTVARNALLVQKSFSKCSSWCGYCRNGRKYCSGLSSYFEDGMKFWTKQRASSILAKTLEHPEYSEKDRQRDISLIYFQTSVKIVRAVCSGDYYGWTFDRCSDEVS